MKIRRLSTLASLMMSGSLLFGQPTVPIPGPPPPPESPKPQAVFDLDFPGGPPEALVKAMERALGKSINVIVPKQETEVLLPAMKLKQVTVSELFDALRLLGRDASTSNERMVYEFVSAGGRTKDDTIWVFHCMRQRISQPQLETANTRICRVYNLRNLLGTGQFKVEDITKAVETGWTGLGVQPMPKLVFNRETELLVAVGAPEHLSLIDEVVKQLSDGAGIFPGRFPMPRPATPGVSVPTQPGTPGSVPGVVAPPPGAPGVPGRVNPPR